VRYRPCSVRTPVHRPAEKRPLSAEGSGLPKLGNGCLLGLELRCSLHPSSVRLVGKIARLRAQSKEGAGPGVEDQVILPVRCQHSCDTPKLPFDVLDIAGLYD
jgi:hypothetical protein